ncbi:unnamed protein product, partial [marine sediment metagenome]
IQTGAPSEYPRALDLKVNAESGIYDVVAVYNWYDNPYTMFLLFGRDLGLDPEKEYLVYDSWKEELVGVWKDMVRVEVPPHGVRVFTIKPLDNSKPQLLGTSRHITGAFSIEDLDWDSSELTLTGRSKTVPDAPYSLFIHVPQGMALSKADASVEVLSYEYTDNLLEVTFSGQE